MDNNDIQKLTEAIEMQNLINIANGQSTVRNLDKETIAQVMATIRTYAKEVVENRSKDKDMQDMLNETKEQYSEFDQRRSL